MRAGVAAMTGIEMPVFEKRRFQEGAVDDHLFAELFAAGEAGYRDHFNGLHAAVSR